MIVSGQLGFCLQGLFSVCLSFPQESGQRNNTTTRRQKRDHKIASLLLLLVLVFACCNVVRWFPLGKITLSKCCFRIITNLYEVFLVAFYGSAEESWPEWSVG